MSTARFVEVLGEAPGDTMALGGKGASLSRLVEAGFRVPPGFVVTVAALGECLAHLGLQRAVDALARALADGREVDGTAIQQRLREGRLPKALAESIVGQAAALDLPAPGTALIVRSSATIEDGGSYSFAGIFESFVVEEPSTLERMILEVWASLFSPRALAYLRESGLRTLPGMAVVVQRFLPATRSGVMFTEFASPSAERQVLVEHVEGGCDKLVKGEVTPDRAWLPRFEAPFGDVGPLPIVHAGSLVELAHRLEDLFGAPQDVEWVLADDVVHVVQSRPITALDGRDGERDGRRNDEPALLTGVPASKGRAGGPVHLVFNIEHAEQIHAGDVLVTPMTNPDMVVAMRRSAAVVTDVGGIICHAAIVSRELGLPCIVGTERATEILSVGRLVTVDGWTGRVHEGVQDRALDAGGTPARDEQGPEWELVWDAWMRSPEARGDRIPLAPSLGALEAAPTGLRHVAVVPDVDVRCDRRGLWQDLEALDPTDRERLFDGYVRAVAEVSRRREAALVTFAPIDESLVEELRRAIARVGEAQTLRCDRVPVPATPIVTDGVATRAPSIEGVHAAVEAAVDTLRFFGHRPEVRVAPMPSAKARSVWWRHLPEYGRFHLEFGTERENDTHEWLEVRPELVISALLKSLVQPGFEMVPRVLGFRDLPPMHIKWIRCRYHFRADVFSQIWEAIVRATWDPSWMARLFRRIRASYTQLEEVLTLFPSTDEELSRTSNEQAVALVTSWWPRWVEFFALCWFVQAQGDDVLYPFLEETVADNLRRIGAGRHGAMPGSGDLIAPLTPVLSAEYMRELGDLGAELRAAGFNDPKALEASLRNDEQPHLRRLVDEHLERWHWMRDRDLLFEPWDTWSVVLPKALRAPAPGDPRYDDNRRRNLQALAFHVDLARASGREGAVATAGRFLHDLNVERENHHVLWLKFSYPLRRLVVELGRRLADVSDLEVDDVFFIQAPELLSLVLGLPKPPPDHLVTLVKNRRRGFVTEARLVDSRGAEPDPEDDYY